MNRARPRIGLNLSYLVPGETGGSEIYARALVPALAAARGGADDLVVFASPELGEELARRPWVPGLEVVRLRVPARTRVRRTLAEQTLVAGAAHRARVEVLHSLASTAPAFTGAANVVTILDVIYAQHPEAHTRVLGRGMGALVALAARRADRIITISQASKADIVAELRVAPGQIDVTYLGPGIDVAHPTPEIELRARLALGDAPLVLTPSAGRAHKNVARLLEALARVDAAPQPVLVVPGYRGAQSAALEARAAQLGLAERVRFCGWVSDEDLAGLYEAAEVLCFPSLAEGFGLPVLEAMRRGLPVACSRTTSLPEVAGDAALLFDPRSVERIAASVTSLLEDRALRERLADRGRERAREFTWERTASGTLAAYDRALAARAAGR